MDELVNKRTLLGAPRLTRSKDAYFDLLIFPNSSPLRPFEDPGLKNVEAKVRVCRVKVKRVCFSFVWRA